MSDTPKTDAVDYLAIPALGNHRWAAPSVVPASFAREQERAIAELVEALKGVVRVADRATDEFDMARSLIAKHGVKS